MKWTRTETMPLSRVRCAYCAGTGLQKLAKGDEGPCNCVLRAIFRACYRRFLECSGRNPYGVRLSPERGSTLCRSGGWGRKEEEYVADFCLVAKRTLTPEEYRVFVAHFLLGGDYRICCRKWKMDRGTFFHMIYRIQRKLGRAFRETEPYPLFPMSDYFAGPQRVHSGIVTMPPQTAKQAELTDLRLSA